MSRNLKSKIEPKWFPKCVQGPPRERPKRRPKTKRKINEANGMGGSRGHAGSAAKLSRGGGVPPKPCGDRPCRGTQNPMNTHLVQEARWRILDNLVLRKITNLKRVNIQKPKNEATTQANNTPNLQNSLGI